MTKKISSSWEQENCVEIENRLCKFDAKGREFVTFLRHYSCSKEMGNKKLHRWLDHIALCERDESIKGFDAKVKSSHFRMYVKCVEKWTLKFIVQTLFLILKAVWE